MDNIESVLRGILSFDFLQALAVLEELRDECFPEKRITFTSDPSLVFPQNEICSVSADEKEIIVCLSFLGLTGSSSPLPMYFCDYIARCSEGAECLADFFGIFQNRIHILYHKALKKFSPSRETRNIFAKVISLLGSFHFSDNESYAHRLYSLCPFFTCGIRTANNLRKLLSIHFGNIPVMIQENIPRWAHVENRKTLGNGSGLGGDDILGETVYDRTGKFKLTIGPVDLNTYKSFMSGEVNHEAVKDLVAFFADTPLYYELEVRCMRKELIPAALGIGGRLNCDLALGVTEKMCGVHSARFELDSLRV